MSNRTSESCARQVLELKVQGGWPIIKQELRNIERDLEKQRRLAGIDDKTPKLDFRYKLGGLAVIEEILSWEENADLLAKNMRP